MLSDDGSQAVLRTLYRSFPQCRVFQDSFGRKAAETGEHLANLVCANLLEHIARAERASYPQVFICSVRTERLDRYSRLMLSLLQMSHSPMLSFRTPEPEDFLHSPMRYIPHKHCRVLELTMSTQNACTDILHGIRGRTGPILGC